MYTFSQLWWVFPVSIVFSTIAIGSGVSGALFFSPFFMLVVGLTPVQAVGAGLLTEVFGMGNGLRSYVRAKLVDYASARWLLVGSIPAVVLGALGADGVGAVPQGNLRNRSARPIRVPRSCPLPSRVRAWRQVGALDRRQVRGQRDDRGPGS